MLAVVLVLLGLVLAGCGVWLATERPRPINLAGAVLAPIGICLALVGAGRLMSPTFWGEDGPAVRRAQSRPTANDARHRERRAPPAHEP
jgi:hypothetical protein